MDPPNLQSEMAHYCRMMGWTHQWLLINEFVEGKASIAFNVIMLLHGEDTATRICKGVFNVVHGGAWVVLGITYTSTLEDNLMGRVVMVEKRVWGKVEGRWFCYEVIGTVERPMHLDW